jgi:hypothetical protein
MFGGAKSAIRQIVLKKRINNLESENILSIIIP